MKQRAVKMPDDLWALVQAEAKVAGLTAGEWIRDALSAAISSDSAAKLLVGQLRQQGVIEGATTVTLPTTPAEPLDLQGIIDQVSGSDDAADLLARWLMDDDARPFDDSLIGPSCELVAAHFGEGDERGDYARRLLASQPGAAGHLRPEPRRRDADVPGVVERVAEPVQLYRCPQDCNSDWRPVSAAARCPSCSRVVVPA